MRVDDLRHEARHHAHAITIRAGIRTIREGKLEERDPTISDLICQEPSSLAADGNLEVASVQSIRQIEEMALSPSDRGIIDHQEESGGSLPI
jgi:hypothetical protein